ncbi:MAG: glycosyltransferase family 9 protein, partial [Chthoniobacteraceae bacterium]|nr:glycosyltransferase family 9 protein [Chthoniobacteraceae bacterium]
MKPRLLVWETHHLGDAVMSIPFLRGVLARYEVTVVCRPSQVAVYEAANLPLSLRVWQPFWLAEGGITAKLRSLLSLGPLLASLRRKRFSSGVSVWADLRIQLLLVLAGTKIQAGLPMTENNFYGSHLPWRAKKLRRGRKIASWIERLTGRPLVTNPVEREPRWHHVDCWSALAGLLECQPDFSLPWFPAPAPPQSLESFVRLQKSLGRRIWAVHPGARTAAKRWPRANYERLIADTLLGHGQSVILIEENQPTAIENRSDAFCSIRTDSIADLLGVLGAGDCFLGNDSFPAHAAAALGLEVWTIFSSADPGIFCPCGHRERVI